MPRLLLTAEPQCSHSTAAHCNGLFTRFLPSEGSAAQRRGLASRPASITHYPSSLHLIAQPLNPILFLCERERRGACLLWGVAVKGSDATESVLRQL